MKRVLTGAAVLWGLALFFAGCAWDTEEEKPADQDAVTVGGYAVQWTSYADPDGSAFDRPILGRVTFYPGLSGHGFTAPANTEAVYREGELADEAAFAGESVELVNQRIQDLPVSGANGTAYIYIHGTDWRKITLTLLPPENTVPHPHQIVEYNASIGNNAAAARLTVGIEDKWYRFDAESAEGKIIRAIYEPNKPGAAKSAGDGKTAADYTPALSAAVLKLFTVTSTTAIEIRGNVLPAAGDYRASSNNLIVIDAGIPNTTADNGDLPLFSIPDRGLGSRGSNYAHIRLRVNAGAQLAVLADNAGYNPSGASGPCPTGLFAGGCVEVMAGGKLRVGAYDGFPLGENAVVLSRPDSYLMLGPASGTPGYNGSYDSKFSGYFVGPPPQGSGDPPRIEWDAGQSTGIWLEMRQGRIATNAQLTVTGTAWLSHSVWFAGDATITVDSGGKLYADESTARNLDVNFYANTTRTVISIKENATFDRRFLRQGAEAAIAEMINGNTVTFPIHGTTTGELVTYINGTGISGYLIPDQE
jgi:hypothetical protein